MAATGPDRRGGFINGLYGSRSFAQGLWETGVAAAGPPGAYGVYPKHRLGTLRYLEDGRIFAYALNGTGALTPGMLVQTPAPAAGANLQAANVLVLAAANVDSINMAKTVAVNQNASNLAANFFQDGYMYVRNMNNSAVNAAAYYKIRSHPATNANTTNTNYCVFTLYDDLQVSLATTSNVAFVPNPYSQVIVTPTTPTSRVAGIAPIAVAANAYFWLQIEGPCGAIANAALAINVPVCPSNLAAGSVMPGSVSANAMVQTPIIGHALDVGVTGFGCFIYLKIV